MIMGDYKIMFEIAGPFAMWARPDTGSTPTSYPVPTWSAAKGICESIAFFNDGRAWINPKRVEICKLINGIGGQINFQKYTNNYRGPNSKKENFQFSTFILVDVCYRIYAVIENGSGIPLRKGDNPCHHLQALFERRLQKGQCHKTPCLGWNEFVPSYWGCLRNDKTEVDKEINLNLVSVLHKVFAEEVTLPDKKWKYQTTYQNATKAFIINGEFKYD
jgi:CRISPR-associated protein Cas5d